jgi:hypothetical protein
MRTGTTDGYPVGLESILRRLERWRENRNGRSRIPERLWTAAVKAVARYGLHPTARALRLDYYSLKKHVESAGREPRDRRAASAGGRERETGTTFVELPAPVSMGSSECILEMEDPRGAKMRIHLKGMPAPDLAGLSRSFWDIGVRPGESRRRRT